MKTLECSRCGVDRNFTVVAKVSAGGLTLSFRRLCFPCLLQASNLWRDGKFDCEAAMWTVAQAQKYEDTGDANGALLSEALKP